MKRVNVLVSHLLQETHLKQIAEVDRRVQVSYAADQVTMELRRAARGEPRGAEEEELDRLLRGTEVLFTTWLPLNLLERAPTLRWLQLASAGADHLVGTGILESRVVVTNASGVAAVPIAEHTIAFMLMFSKEAIPLLQAQRERRWVRVRPGELQGRTLGIVGLGAIGSQVARLARAFSMEVLAYDPHVPESYARERGAALVALSELLRRSDFVSINAALTGKTRNLLGEKELHLMKPTAYLMNTARGAVVNEGALARALREGWIAGAALDVFETEPLPPESELWTLPNAILTPHIAAGRREVTSARETELFCDNLQRYLAGRPLRNVVDAEGKRIHTPT